MKKLIYTLFIAILAAGLTACKGGESISMNPGSLQGDWQATAMNGQQMQSQSKYTVSFNTDGTVAGVAGCNRFAGEYTAKEKGSVSMNDVSSTKLNCDSNSQQYIDALTSANSYKVMGGNQLELASSSGSGTLVFTKVMMEEGGS